MAAKAKKKSVPKKPVAIDKAGKREPSNKKKQVTRESQEAFERAQWQKEKRLYWSSRFRRMLAEMAIKPKTKKASVL